MNVRFTFNIWFTNYSWYLFQGRMKRAVWQSGGCIHNIDVTVILMFAVWFKNCGTLIFSIDAICDWQFQASLIVSVNFDWRLIIKLLWVQINEWYNESCRKKAKGHSRQVALAQLWRYAFQKTQGKKRDLSMLFGIFPTTRLLSLPSVYQRFRATLSSLTSSICFPSENIEIIGHCHIITPNIPCTSNSCCAS